jgi:hypothetical protein
MTGHTYTANCRREPGWWVATVDELDGIATQARRLDLLEVAVRGLIAAWLDTDENSFEVHLVPQLDETIADQIERARQARQEADRLSSTAAEAVRAAAAELSAQGMPIRDIGRILGVSHQRAAQLIGRSRSHKRSA